MLWFRKRPSDLRDEDPDVLEARAAQLRAHASIQKVVSQQDEVAQLTTALEMRRRQNNFGRALEIAMEARTR